MEADADISAFLFSNGYSRLAAMRSKYILFLKLIDVVYFARRTLLQFDSDVLCLQRPTTLLSALADTTGTVNRYNRDFGPAMSFSDEDLQSFLGRPVAPSYNSGLLLTTVPDKRVFFDFAESLLSRNYSVSRPWVLEQTMWAAWSTMQRGSALPDEYDCTFRHGSKGFLPEQSVITQHYCAYSSSLFFQDFAYRVYPTLAPEDFVRRVILRSIRSGTFDVSA